MERSEATLAIIGGGVYVAPLLRALARMPGMPRLRIRLAARDRKRLEIIGAHARRFLTPDAPGWEIQTCGPAREAVAGAEAVVLLARIGGPEARTHDETFPHEFGWVGDEGLGLGGLANAWRTLPALETIGSDLAETSPRALVLNLMAPLPLTTRLLGEQGLRVIGVCELPTMVERSVGCGAQLEYLGLNHLGWFWPVPGRESILSRAVTMGRVHPETVERYGAIPLPYYYRVLRPDLGRELGIVAPVGRAKELSSVSERIFRRMLDPSVREIPEFGLRPTPWFDHAVAPVLHSFWSGTPFRGFVNGGAAGRSLVPCGLPAEYRARFTRFGLAPELPSRVPRPVRAFLEEVSGSMTRMYLACRSRELSDLNRAAERLCPGLPRSRLRDALRAVRARVPLDAGGTAAPDRQSS